MTTLASNPSEPDFNLIQSPNATSQDLAARRSDLAKKYRTEHAEPVEDVNEQLDIIPEQLLDENEQTAPLFDGDEETNSKSKTTPRGNGTILEAAFVDPAYSWPPAEGQGKNAIELQASVQLLDEEEDSVVTTESQKARLRMPDKPIVERSVNGTKFRLFRCCSKASTKDVLVSDAEQLRAYEEKKLEIQELRRLHAEEKRQKLRNKEKEYRMKHKYSRVPEGILIYRFDTSTGDLELMSEPHSNTNLDTLVRKMHVVEAYPSKNKSRRGLDLVDDDGTQATLIACEQRTATAWLEAMQLMHAKNAGMMKRTEWTKEKLSNKELDAIESSYMNLAHYSHKLIRAGALPGTKKGSGGAGGIYYSVEKVQPLLDSPQEEEALEAIAKRRAVIKDSWDFYRMICSLLRDRAKYEEVFRKLQLDPVYPYLNSMTGLNDPGDVGYENLDKQVIQRDLPPFSNMTKIQVARELVKQAEKAMPSLVEICKALAGSLGMEEVGVGPIKEPEAAIRKAEKKYGGDILKVTDYCRALLVVKDIPSLLALLELARDSFGPLITRVKMSSLKQDHLAKPGGYRDCIINVELKGHICEIQVHLWPMWVICGVDGFRHYRHCVEYNTDSFEDPYDALDGLDRKTMAELIVVAEEAVSETPLDNLEWYHEKFILDYFAEAGLFMKHNLDVWAEIIFRHLIRLRTESPDIGPDHHSTIILYKYLAQCLRTQGKKEEAKEVMMKVHKAEISKNQEKTDASKSMWESLGEVYDMVVDPSRKEREAEEKLRKEVKLSKKRWRKIRHERFPFLDVDIDGKNNDIQHEEYDEKKVDETSM